jgi:hypothetical protein
VIGWAPGPVWKGAENLTPTGIRSPDRPYLSLRADLDIILIVTYGNLKALITIFIFFFFPAYFSNSLSITSLCFKFENLSWRDKFVKSGVEKRFA